MNAAMLRKDLKSKRVTVVGLGLHGGGAGTVRFLAEEGARVLVTDIKKREELLPSIEKLKNLNITYVLGQHRPEDFVNTDLIVRNPAVPLGFKYFALARKKQIPVTSDVALFFEFCPGVIAAVTGTKGKSTTAALLAAMVNKTYPTVLAGNIGVATLSVLNKITPASLVVLELSSWQLEDLAPVKTAPRVAIITNITQDHLDRHQNVAQYIAAKKLIFQRQKPTDVVVLNYDDPVTQKLGAEAKSAPYYFSARFDLPGIIAQASRYQVGAFVRGEALQFGRAAEEILALKDIPLAGEHNLANVLAAVTAARLLKAPPKQIRRAVQNFQPLPGRLQLVAEVKGVKYINDTTATNPTALKAALTTLAKPGERSIILIAGGADKKLAFDDVGPIIQQSAKAVILLAGEASAKLAAALAGAQVTPPLLVNSMAEAVGEASGRAAAGDSVLLSPGASSFNMFINEFDRGAQFEAAVSRL